MLSEIAAYLTTQSLGVLGTDLFVLVLPKSPSVCTTLWQYQGQPGELLHSGTGDEKPSIQVRTRATAGDDLTALTRLAAIRAVLHGFSNTTLGAHKYKLIKEIGGPVPLGNDDEGRPEWAQNYQIIKEA